MNVRSITLFTHRTPDDRAFDPLVTCVNKVRTALTNAGYEVETLRLALPPWPLLTDAAVELGEALDTAGPEAGFDYVSLGPVTCRSADDLDRLSVIPKVLGATENVFMAAHFADRGIGVYTDAALTIADVIQANATLESHGFANLRFAALANVGPGSPFLPAAYAEAEAPPALALALESGDLTVDAFTDAPGMPGAAARLRKRLEGEGKRLAEVVTPVCERHSVRFHGLDFSLAPFPTPAQSTAAGIEALGAAPFGAAGTLAAAALTTHVLQEAAYPRCGFSGLMLPVLEDATLAERAGTGSYTLHSLLAFSAVCGTGLDTMPLPGDVGRKALAGILLDVGALAVQLDKPLTARLMPIPGKRAGERTDFDFPYFANATILDVVAPAGGALFAGGYLLG